MIFLEEGRALRLPGLLYTDELVLCGESEEDLKVIVGGFVEVNAGKGKVMVLRGEEGLKYEMYVDEEQLEQVSEFKDLGCVLD